MKQYGTLIALAVAVTFGIVAVILANKWLSTQVPEQKQVIVQDQIPVTKIVVAAQDLDIGSPLNDQTLLLADWPKANVPKGAFTKIEEVDGRVTVTRIVAGIPIVAAELAAPGSGAGLVASIKPGMRAMAIKVNEVIGVAGFVLPNTFVDVIFIEKDSSVAETLLKRVEVLAIAQQTFVEEGKAKVVNTVTLELTPKQVLKLAESTHKGPLTLALLNPAEDIAEPPKPEPKPVKVAKKRRAYKRRPVAPKVPTYDIVVIKGTKSVETVKLKDQN